jgi:hypothetical protein
MTSSALALNTIDETFRMANGLLQSGLLPKSLKTAQQVFAIITLGQELGFAAWQSINSIDVIQGKPTLKPQAMLAKINASGVAESVVVSNLDEIKRDKAATVTMKRKNGMSHTVTFTWEMAALMETKEWDDSAKQSRQIPLIEKYNWRTMPEIMMMWRAVSMCARVVFSDVIMGMYTPDEIGSDEIVSDDMRIEMTPPLTVVPKEEPSQPQLTSGSETPVEYADELNKLDENGDDLPEIEAPEEAPKAIEAVAPAFDKSKWDAASATAWYQSRLNNPDFEKPTKDDVYNALKIKTKLSEFKGGGWDAADAALRAYFGTPVEERHDPVRDANVRLGTKNTKLGQFPSGIPAEVVQKVEAALTAVESDPVLDASFEDIVGEDEIEDNIQDLATPAPARQWYEPKPEAAPAPAALPAFKKDEMKTLLVEGRVHMQQIGKSANSVCYSFPVIGDLNAPEGKPDKRIEFAEVMSRKVFEGTGIDASVWPKDNPKVQTDEGMWVDLGWKAGKTTFTFECEFNGKEGWIIKKVSE